MDEFDEETIKALVEQFKAHIPQIDILNKYLLIMSRKADMKQTAQELKIGRADLEDLRSNTLDLLLEFSKVLDAEAAKAGIIGTTLTETGVGVFTCERLTRLAINLLNEMSPEEATERAGFKADVAPVIKSRISKKLLYIAAIALTDFPKLTVVELFKSINNPLNFVLWHNDASALMEEDDKLAEQFRKNKGDSK